MEAGVSRTRGADDTQTTSFALTAGFPSTAVPQYVFNASPECTTVECGPNPSLESADKQRPPFPAADTSFQTGAEKIATRLSSATPR